MSPTLAFLLLLAVCGFFLWLLLRAATRHGEQAATERAIKATLDAQKQQTELANELREIAETKPTSRADSLNRLSAKNHLRN